MMKRIFTILIAAIAAIMMMGLPEKAVGQVSTATATSGNSYVVAYYVNNKYYALPHGTSSGVWDGTEVELNSINKVDTETAEDLSWTLTEGSTTGQFYITHETGSSKKYLIKSGTTGNNKNINVTGTSSTDNLWEFSLNTGNSDYTVKSLKSITSGTTGAGLIYLGYATAGKYGVYASNSAVKIILLEIGDAPTTYTVSFDCDGGTANCPEDIEDLEEGDDFTIPSTVPTRECYTFGGWFDDEFNEYELGETYPCPASDLTLTADWTQNKYNITYKPNGATGNNVVVENQNCGSSYTIAGKPNAWTAPVATPNFVNWNTQADGQGTTYTVGQVITISDHLELYAQWSATASYTVTYDCNGVESGCPDNATVLDGTQITLPAAPTYAGHTFNGWMCDADLQTYAAGANYTVTSDVEFEAQWLENLSNPTFNVTGVSNGTDNTYYVTATIEIEIEQEDGAYIYYTTDGTDPTDASNEYTAAFEVTNSCTIKAIAISDGYGNSQIASQEIIIVQPNVATFTSGAYSESFGSSLGLWYAYNVTGDKVWAQGSTTYSNTTYTGANINGYQQDNEDWLISPKMTAENGKVVVSFSSVARYSSSYTLVVKYSTNYNGYGAPSEATWKTLSPTIASAPSSGFSSWTASGNVAISELSTSTDPLTNSTPIYVAFVYTSATGSGNASQYFIKDFTAKQCYPITYYANGGSGTTADANSPYAVGTEVTILDNAFTAPDGKEFIKWNTQSDGLGTDKYPENNITMTTTGYELYAIWGDACVLTATMNATTGEAVYDYNSGEKRFNITPSSSVKTLGGCDIYDYGFVYSTTVEDPEIDADNCTKVQVGETQPEVDVEFNTTLNGLTLGETYHVRSYATNAAGTAYSEVIDVAVPANFDEYRYEISYTTNGTAEASTYVYQGAPISGLATPTEANVPEGFTFMGWYGVDYALSNTAPTYVKNGDEINGNLALKAVFAIQTGGGSADTYSLVVNVDDLNDGDIVVLYSVGTYTYSQTQYNFSKANGGISNSLFADVDVTVDDNQFTSTDVVPMKLVKSNTSWKLKIGNQFVSALNKGATLDDNGSLNTITISNGTATITATISATNYRLQYNPNNGNGRFAYYSSNQKSVKLFKQNTPIYSSYCTSVSYVSDMAVEGYGVNEGGYYLIASPVATTPVVAGMITDDGTDPENRSYDLYYFDQSEENEWQNYRTQTFILEPGKGYLYASKEDLVGENRLSFTGAPYSGDGIINLDYDENATFAGWNLIGNPYNEEKALDKSFYRINPEGRSELIAATGNVEAMEGVFVKATAANQTATFTAVNPGAKKISKFNVMVARDRGTVLDNAIIRFDEGNTLEKFSFRAGSTKLYFTENHKDYAIVRSNNQGELPVNFKASKNGTYTLSVKPENVEVSYLHLIDNLTGANVDLLANPSYTFEANTTDYASRFRLVFKTNADVEDNTATETFAYYNGSEWVINGTGNATLQVIDVMGRVLRSEQINGNTAINLNQAAGIYMLRLINGENVMVQKVVVR